MSDDTKDRSDDNSIGENSTEIAATWNENQEMFLKSTSERANCMRWLHNQCNLYFDNLNFYFTIPNVVISTLNGSFTMSLNSLFPEPAAQKYATTIIGLVSILSAILITMNQYMKSQQMMEAHRSAGLSYGKLHRMICNELAVRRDQRSNAIEFLKLVKAEQDRLESTSPNILPKVIKKFNKQFIDRTIEKPEIAGDLDETVINRDVSLKRRDDGRSSPSIKSRIAAGLRKMGSFNTVLNSKRVNPTPIPEEDETGVLDMMMDTAQSEQKKKDPPFTLSIQKP